VVAERKIKVGDLVQFSDKEDSRGYIVRVDLHPGQAALRKAVATTKPIYRYWVRYFHRSDTLWAYEKDLNVISEVQNGRDHDCTGSVGDDVCNQVSVIVDD
jgi:hypothetical protein